MIELYNIIICDTCFMYKMYYMIYKNCVNNICKKVCVNYAKNKYRGIDSANLNNVLNYNLIINY